MSEQESKFNPDAADFASSLSERNSTEYSDASDNSNEDFSAGLGSESKGHNWAG